MLSLRTMYIKWALPLGAESHLDGRISFIVTEHCRRRMNGAHPLATTSPGLFCWATTPFFLHLLCYCFFYACLFVFDDQIRRREHIDGYGLLQQSAVLMQEGSEQQGHDDERQIGRAHV